MQLVIVESPAKAKTINKYLGSDYKVLASFGHVRDLPSKEGSVRPDDDFAMVWDVDPKAKKHLDEIAAAFKGATALILATDPDREGEAISWHVLEELQRKKLIKGQTIQRVAFNAITKTAILEAMQHPRAIDQELVNAYLARRSLDYLVGFTLSPVLWRKLPGARSAGRVQSVALKLIVEREQEIEAFRAQEYWTIEAEVSANSDPFSARLITLDGQKLEKFSLGDEASALAARDIVQASDFVIGAIEKKPSRRNPPPPFTTSTLQQEAARKLGFSAQRTMQAAQKLYEGVNENGGLITYMRTDGVQTAPEAIAEARQVIAANFGANYLPASPRLYKTKAKNAQEAHEAIRPTNLATTPQKLSLEGDLFRLYELIWKRMAASQMESAKIERTVIDLHSQDEKTVLRANGQVVLFDGYLAVYEEGRDDSSDESEARLPQVTQGTKAKIASVKADQHHTEAPPRYSEASLVKKMEELGIGRPSTYASIISVLRDRGYVEMEKNRFVPDDKGRILTAFLAQFFGRYIAYDFTADLEERLDLVAGGELDWKTLLQNFWKDFHAAVKNVGDLRITEVIEVLNTTLGPYIFPERDDGIDPRLCPHCHEGRLSLKLSRFGSFIGCSAYPECRFTRQVSGPEGAADMTDEPVLGEDPATRKPIHLKKGRFGPYLELEGENPPKRIGIPKALKPEDVDLAMAVKLLSLPRDIGPHPEDGQMIIAGLGKYGPYINHAGVYVRLKDWQEVLDVGLNRAVTLLEDKKSQKGASGNGAASRVKPLLTVGKDPQTGEEILLLDGRFGPYLRSRGLNVNLPKGLDLADLTQDLALGLIEAKAGKTPVTKTTAVKKTGAKKLTAGKTTKDTAKNKAIKSPKSTKLSAKPA